MLPRAAATRWTTNPNWRSSSARPRKSVTRGRRWTTSSGYTCANDVSARDWQRDKARCGGQWCRGKSFDGFCPLGPWIVTTDEIPNPNALRDPHASSTAQMMQDSNTGDMIFDVPTLIESLSAAR